MQTEKAPNNTFPCGLKVAVWRQVSANFFAYRPILDCLQSMVGVPMADELVLGRSPQSVTYPLADELEQELHSITTLDDSQRQALQQGLTQRVTLIQVGCWVGLERYAPRQSRTCTET
jgi:hypothetical protein